MQVTGHYCCYYCSYGVLYYLVFHSCFRTYSFLFNMKGSHRVRKARAKERWNSPTFSLSVNVNEGTFYSETRKENSLRATTSPSPQLSLGPQNGYVTKAWELILSRCLQSKQDQKVETEISKHLIRS